MTVNANRKLVLVWAVLVGITLLSWLIGSNTAHATALVRDDLVTWGVIAIAAIKVRFILRGFMEVDHAPAWLKRLTDAWLALAIAALLIFYSMHWGITI